MTDTTTAPQSAAVTGGQPADTQAQALPFGVSAEQHAAAIADAQARGIYDPNEPTMNEETATLDKAIQAFPVADNPEQYNLTEYPVDASDGDEVGAHEFDVWRRSALHAAGFPRDMAGSVVAACVAAEKRFANETPADRELTILNTHAELARLWGDRTQTNLDLANKFLDYVEAKSPGVLAYLDASGAANDIAVIAAVVAQAERFVITGGKL